MSAFIVSNDTINAIVTFAQTKAMGDNTFTFSARDFLKSVDEDGTGWSTAFFKRLGQRLYALNVSAVSQRYPGESIESLPGPIDAGYRYERNGCTAVEAYKALGCLLYQCSEGDVPERALFLALETLQHDIAHAIVCGMPEYDRAQTWH